jgi:DNA polymerase I
MEKVFIVDAVNYLFRAYYAIGPMTNNEGQSTSALYGFIRSINKLIKDFSPKNLVIVFDGPDNKQSRKEVYADYKMHRKAAPEDLYPQIELAYNYCQMAGISAISMPGVEADDTMASIAKWSKEEGYEVYICTSDKDLFQMVDKNVFVLNTGKNNLKVDENKVKEIFGITPRQMLDFLAITGDKSDNIPGIEGFGPKTAALLLQEFDTLDNILKNIDKVKGESKQKKLREQQDKAILSKKLATLHLDVKFPQTKEFLEIKKPDLNALREFYQEMKFMTLLREVGDGKEETSQEKTKITKTTQKANYELIDSIDDLEKLVEKLSKKHEIAIDTETTSTNPLLAKLVGIGLSVEEGSAYYIPTNGKIKEEEIISSLTHLFSNENISFIGHNIKYDLHVLKTFGLEIKNICFDTMLASYLLNPQSQRHNLDRLVLENFGKIKIAITSLIGEKKPQKSMMDIPIEKVCDYCCEDVDYTLRLKNLFLEKLKSEKLYDLFSKMELPLLFVLAQMEEAGIFINEKYFESLKTDLSHLIKDLEKQIHKQADEDFNINSPKQLAKILFEKLGLPKSPKTKESTTAPVLEKLALQYPFVKKILSYRTLQKLQTTYVETLPKQINPNTDRIHTTFNQSVTATGRLSSQNPNLQNIPIRSDEGKKIRKGFRPQKNGWSYISADYSQIELRLLAHLSEDSELIRAFKNGEDIHAFTAAAVFKVAEKDVTKQMRYMAKAVNFGIIYGQGPYGLASQIGVSGKEAKEFIDKYFERFPQIPKYLEKVKKEVEKSKVSTTIFGRKRPIPEISNKNFNIRAGAQRLATNTPLQGSAADLIKIAMIEIDKSIKEKKLEGYMILQVHDELIFEIPDSEVVVFKSLVKEKMENIHKFKVPIVVDIEVGKNWGEC